MTVASGALATDLRLALGPLGLSTAVGFDGCSIPFGIASISALIDLRRA
jgi:hypothetical protein